MPRKPEPSFELKLIIWDVAAAVGKDKPTVIQRQLDYELEKRRKEEGDFFEDAPDVRTISRIVKEINELDPRVVVAKLPSHVWTLRDDYESIKRLAEGKGQSSQLKANEKQTTLATEQISRVIRHDVKIFEESDAILSEQDIEFVLGIELEAARFIGHSEVSALVGFYAFFSFGEETNKYINLTLRSLSESVCQKLVQLQPLIHDLFIEGSTYDGAGKKIHGRVLSELMPPEDIRQLMQLSASCRAAYRSYRAAVRETLYL